MNDVVYNCCFRSTLSIMCRNIHWHNVLISELGPITILQAACDVGITCTKLLDIGPHQLLRPF